MVSHKLGPRRELDPFVSFVRVTDARLAPPPTPFLRLPDGQLELSVCIDAQAGALKVVGPRLRALEQVTARAFCFVNVRFKPGGAYPFFGLPISELTNQLVPLSALWGGSVEALAQSLLAADSHAACAALVEQSLLERLTTQLFEPSSAPSVRRAVRLVKAAPELPSADELARRVGASGRQLRRAFAEVVGMAPKQFLRIERFQRALRAARARPELSFGEVAERVGYFDQSHLNAEFHALAGATPSALCPRRRVARRSASVTT